MDYIIRLRNGAHRSAHREGFRRQFRHRGEALIGKISPAGKETPGRGVEANQYGEKRVQKVPCYFLVDSQEAKPLL